MKPRNKESYLNPRLLAPINSNGVSAPTHTIQYVLDLPEREKEFVESQFKSNEDKRKYIKYRQEWHKRARELDPGSFPLAVTCELASICNLACSMCYTISDDFKNSVTGAQRLLPWPTVKSIIDECADIGVYSMLFSWRGESSLYYDKKHDKDFADVLAYAKQKDILEITSLTHGQTLTKGLIRRIVDADPNWISFSFDGIEDTYNSIRTPPSRKNDNNYNAYEKLIGNISYFKEYRDSKGLKRPQIRSNTIYPAIENNPERYYKALRDLGVDMCTSNELLDLRDGSVPIEMVQKKWACAYPFQRLTVSANGTILPCTGAYLEQEGLVIGTIHGSSPKLLSNGVTNNYSIKEAWTSKEIKEVRRLHKDNARLEIDPGCRHCSHGVKKFGADRIPSEWDINSATWTSENRIG